MLFYKVLILFWGVLELSCLLNNRIIFHIILQLLQYLSPQPDTNSLISSGFDERPAFQNEMCCDWLAVPVRCDWTNSLSRLSTISDK